MLFFRFFPQRGGKILEEVLGKCFKGKIGCDGWSTYAVYSKEYGILLQRCWAHLIREVRYMCKDVPELHEAYVWIMDMFKKIKKLRTIKSKTRRQKGYDQLIADMDKWVKIYRCYRGMKQIVTKVENGGKFWFTCVLHPEIEPTNNSAERGLRKFVVMEK